MSPAVHRAGNKVQDGGMATSFWHPQALMSQVQHDEIVIVRGEGSYLWTDDGTRLLDATAGLWYANIGHGNQRVADAVRAQMAELETFHSFGRFASKPNKDICDRIVGLAPLGPDAKVFLGSGGSDAIDSAAKLARRYFTATDRPQKRIIVSRENAYHGLHGFGTSLGWMEPNRIGYGDLDPAVLRASATDADDVEKVIMNAGPEFVAAFFAEPIIGAGGVIFPGEEYLHRVRELCREHDILFVADEVICGFGRTGEWFASGKYNLDPDMITFAKGVTSGYLPLGGVIVAPKVTKPFWEDGSQTWFKHGLTYSGHATCCAAAMANLDVIEQDGLVDRVATLEKPFAEAMQSLSDDPHVIDVRTPAGLLGAFQVETAEQGVKLEAEIMARGILCRKVGDGTSIAYSPPFIITEEEIDRMVDAAAQALKTL